MGEKGVKQVIHKVEVGRTPVERELQQEIEARDLTIRALQKDLEDQKGIEDSRKAAAAEALKNRALAAGIDEDTIMSIDPSSDLVTLEKWVQTIERGKGATIQDPVISKRGGPTDPPQGSVVQLNPPRVTPRGEYKNYSDMVDDLYRRADAGEKLAKSQLDRLWGKLDKDFSNILAREGKLPTINVSQCRMCGVGPVIAGKCSSCGAEQNE